jgi:hypothetical protein
MGTSTPDRLENFNFATKVRKLQRRNLSRLEPSRGNEQNLRGDHPINVVQFKDDPFSTTNQNADNSTNVDRKNTTSPSISYHDVFSAKSRSVTKKNRITNKPQTLRKSFNGPKAEELVRG